MAELVGRVAGELPNQRSFAKLPDGKLGVIVNGTAWSVRKNSAGRGVVLVNKLWEAHAGHFAGWEVETRIETLDA